MAAAFSKEETKTIPCAESRNTFVYIYMYVGSCQATGLYECVLYVTYSTEMRAVFVASC